MRPGSFILKSFIISFLILIVHEGIAQEKLTVSPDIDVYKISEHCYVHVSTVNSVQFGKFSSNGLICLNQHKAYLFDTPPNDSLTAILYNWIIKDLQAEVVGFVPNHWHVDCIGGLAYLLQNRVLSYSFQKTKEIAIEKNLPVPATTFTDSLILTANNLNIVCYYPGQAHAVDNICIWIPEDNLLFPGCIIKELASNNLGNTKDGNLETYPSTVQYLIDKFPDVKLVVPGHGQWGDKSLLFNTLDMSTKK